MIDPKLWQHHPDPVLVWPGGACEDLVVVREGTRLKAYFTAGGVLTHQGLYTGELDSPLGPVRNTYRLSHPEAGHTRLYRGQIDQDRQIVTAVTPGLPHVGVWLFAKRPFGVVKTLLIPPLEGTLFSVAAGNPCIIWDGKEFNIFFEGRDERVFWRLFHATWNGKGDEDAPEVSIRKAPIWDGANPSMLVHAGMVYLYYSQWTGGGFESRVAFQPAMRGMRTP